MVALAVLACLLTGCRPAGPASPTTAAGPPPPSTVPAPSAPAPTTAPGPTTPAAPTTPVATSTPAPAATTGATATAGPTTTVPGATTAPAGPAPAEARLSWAPPAGWEDYPVREVTATDAMTVVDARGGDVRIVLPADSAVGPVTVTDCRNAVLIGGQITVLPSATADGQDQRAVYVRDCTGTVHLEGLLVDGDVEGSQSDGIAANAPEAVLQVQNVRIEGVRGTESGNHADVFQPWGGLREFRIDRLTGTSNYQGLHISENLGEIGAGTVRRADVGSSEVTPVEGGGHFLWTDCTDGHPLVFDDVWIEPRAGRQFGRSIWPRTDGLTCPATVTDGFATWPGNPTLTGGVHEGSPPEGDFVPAGTVGLGYVSPGYAGAPG